MLLKDGQQIRRSFTTTGHCMGQDVIAFQDRRDYLPLYDSGVLVVELSAGFH